MKMKLFLLAGLPALLIGACKKGDDVSTTHSSTGNYVAKVSFVVDGRQKCGDDANGGTYSSVYFEVSATDKAGKTHEYHFSDPYNTPGNIQISKFGAVGDSVTGKFSGLLIDEGGEPTIHVTNGSFSITRNVDLN